MSHAVAATPPSVPDLAAPDLAARLRRPGGKLNRYLHGPASGPWFRAHPAAAAAVISASSVGVLALQLLDQRASDAIALLYVLPIGLAAVTFGMVGGLAAAAAAYLAFGLFAVLASAGHVGPDGWIGRAAAMFLLGGLLGRAHDETEQANRLALANLRQRQVAEEKNRRFSEGIELSDSILQHVAAAKWAIEQGDNAKAVELLAQALNSGQDMVAGLLPARSGPPMSADRPPGPAQVA